MANDKTKEGCDDTTAVTSSLMLVAASTPNFMSSPLARLLGRCALTSTYVIVVSWEHARAPHKCEIVGGIRARPLSQNVGFRPHN
jgi:hypothetical protein